MKLLVLPILAVLSGCSTLANVADIEGTGRVGEILRVIKKSDSVLTGRTNSLPTAGRINRLNNQIHNTQLGVQRGLALPYLVQDIQEIGRYLK